MRHQNSLRRVTTVVLLVLIAWPAAASAARIRFRKPSTSELSDRYYTLLTERRPGVVNRLRLRLRRAAIARRLDANLDRTRAVTPNAPTDDVDEIVSRRASGRSAARSTPRTGVRRQRPARTTEAIAPALTPADESAAGTFRGELGGAAIPPRSGAGPIRVPPLTPTPAPIPEVAGADTGRPVPFFNAISRTAP